MVYEKEKLNMKALNMFKKPRIILLIVVILISIILINPTFNTDGVAIKSVEKDSQAYNAGIRVENDLSPRAREIINFVDGQEVKNLEDYSRLISNIENSSTFRLRTNEREYTLLKQENLGLAVDKVAENNLRLGLDLQGGTRVLLKPKEKVDSTTLAQLRDVIDARLNAFGLGDIEVRVANDLFRDDNFIVVEVAGASKEEVEDKVRQQGKFEAKIGEEVVFTGGNDILNVYKNDGTRAYIHNCGQVPAEGYLCEFTFQVDISQNAARKFAEATKDLEVNGTSLSKTIDFYLDDNFIGDKGLLIAADLKGRPATQISISGPGKGASLKEAEQDAVTGMNELQTVLITGSLPVEIQIERLDSISPTVGSEVINNAIKAALVALLAVGLVIYIRYRKFRISVPMMIIVLSEIIITLGVAALFKWNLDLAAIAGIIAAVGTGVDDQIVIADETSKKEGTYNWKERMKRAFFIIMVAYVTTFAVMVTLFWVSAGLFKGFAFTTIVGITIGVLITRPAYGKILESLSEQ